MTTATLAHTRPHPLRGEDVELTSPDAPTTPLRVDDWLDREPRHLPTAYTTPAALRAMWDGDRDLVYGHIGSLGVIVHASELGWLAPRVASAACLLRSWAEA